MNWFNFEKSLRLLVQYFPIEDSKKYDIEVDNSKFTYYYAYVWWDPEPITPLIKSEINNFLALIFNVIDR